MEFAKKDSTHVIVVRRNPEQKEQHRRSRNAALGSLGAFGGSIGAAVVGTKHQAEGIHHAMAAERISDATPRAAKTARAMKMMNSGNKWVKASNVALGGSALLAGKSIYHNAKATPRTRVIHKANNAQKKKLRRKSELQETGAIGAVSGGVMSGYYGAKELGAAGRARQAGFKHADKAAKMEAKSNSVRYGQASNTVRETPPKRPTPTTSTSTELAVRKPDQHRTWAANADSDRAKATRNIGAKFGEAEHAFKAGKRLRRSGLLMSGAGLAGIGAGVELQRRSIKNKKMAISKYETPRQKSEKRKGHAYTAAGAAGLIGGSVGGFHAEDLAASGQHHQTTGRLHHIAGNAKEGAKRISQGNKLMRHANKVAIGSLIASGAGVGLAVKGAHHYRQSRPQFGVHQGKLVQKSLVSKADLERRSWAELSKSLVEVQEPGKTKKRRGAEAGGATAAVLGGTAYVGSIPIKNKAGALASQSEAAAKEAGGISRKRSKNPNDYIHTVRGGGEPKTGTLPDSPPSSPKHGREWAKNRANWHAASAAADRATQARATKVGRIGLGVAALGAGGYGYAKHRQSRKKEFGKALTKEQAEERKGPQLPKNPLVTGGIGAGALGTAVFGGSRVPYHAQMNRMKKHEGLSTTAWKQSTNLHQFGQKAAKDAMKPSGKSTGWDAKTYFQASNAEKAKAAEHSIKSTNARAKAIKTARVGRKGLIAAAGGATAAGIGMAYDKHQKRKAAMA